MEECVQDASGQGTVRYTDGRKPKDDYLLLPVTQDKLNSTISLADWISARLAQSISQNRTVCWVQSPHMQESKTPNAFVLEQRLPPADHC